MAQSTNNFKTWLNEQVGPDSKYSLSPALRSPSLSKISDGVFPTRKDEEWKYTPLGSLFEANPRVTDIGSPNSEFINNLKQAVPGADTLVFVDGSFSQVFSDMQVFKGDGGLKVSQIHDLEDEALKQVEDIILESPLTDDNIFQHITLGLSQVGLFIELTQNTEVQTPLQIIHISSAQSGTSFTNPINVIKLNPNSRLKVIEQFASIGDATVVTLPANYIEINSGSKLDYYRIGTENAKTQHVSNSAVKVSGSGVFNSHQYLLGSELTRSNVEVRFAGQGSQAVLRGVYLGDEDQHLDVRTYMDHAHPHCNSDQHFRGILNGSSRGVFNGLVLVREHAQQTDAKQSNKNLLLSRDARIDTKPQLEIFADDVKCTHGATVGELDTDALFYLQSRGIDKKEAALMLTRAFAAEVTQEIEIDSLQNYVQEKISAALDEIVLQNV